MSRRVKKPRYEINVKALGLRIHLRRRSLNMTQQQLADMAGCTTTHLCRIESGKAPSLLLLYSLCKALNTTMDEMLGMNIGENFNSFRVRQIIDQSSEAEQELAFQILSLLDRFHHRQHRSSLYNRYSEKALKPQSPWDLRHDDLLYMVAEDPSNVYHIIQPVPESDNSEDEDGEEKIPAAPEGKPEEPDEMEEEYLEEEFDDNFEGDFEDDEDFEEDKEDVIQER